MSRPYQRDPQDPLRLAAFDERLLDDATRAAKASPRKRSIIRLHEHQEPLQRMLNAVEPESYARPHRHSRPNKPEAFVALRGSLLVVRYADTGDVLEGVVVSSEGPVRGIEIPAGAWHSLVALESGTVVFEVAQGPYDEATHKEMAAWAPAEESKSEGARFITELKRRFEALLPAMAAYDQIAAEEDDII